MPCMQSEPSIATGHAHPVGVAERTAPHAHNTDFDTRCAKVAVRDFGCGHVAQYAECGGQALCSDRRVRGPDATANLSTVQL